MSVALSPTRYSVCETTIAIGFGVKAAWSLSTEVVVLITVVTVVLLLATGAAGGGRSLVPEHPCRMARAKAFWVETVEGQTYFTGFGSCTTGATTGMRTLVTVLVLGEGVAEGFEAFRHRVTDPFDTTAD